MTALAADERRYGRWTIIGGPEKDAKGQRKWLCRCDCGTERMVAERSLMSGASLSCGCINREKTSREKSHHLAGQTFGHLTALRRIPKKTKNGGAVWLCRCFCGNSCEVLASLLVTGRKTHCGCLTETHYHYVDITGQTFGRLTALYPADGRTAGGGRIWHCRCECGKELDVPYNELAFTSRQSCGCQKKEHDEQLSGYLTRVAGTSVDALRSRKLPRNNSTGVKGVYLIRGKFVAKIVFQHKQYHLGSFASLEDAAEARREAEEIIAEGTVRHYERWKQRADADPAWGEQNPIQIHADRSESGAISILFLPMMDESTDRDGG